MFLLYITHFVLITQITEILLQKNHFSIMLKLMDFFVLSFDFIENSNSEFYFFFPIQVFEKKIYFVFAKKLIKKFNLQIFLPFNMEIEDINYDSGSTT